MAGEYQDEPLVGERSFIVDIRLTREQLEAFYFGRVTDVQARDIYGARIQFPLRNLRPYVAHGGISGRFRLVTDQNHKLVNLKKIG